MPRPLPDVNYYSHRDYGTLAALALADARGNGRVWRTRQCLSHRHRITILSVIEEEARGIGEFFSHGVYNTRYLYGMNEAQERAYIEDVIESIDKHIGRRVVGSLTLAITHTERSIPPLAEYTTSMFAISSTTTSRCRSMCRRAR